MVAIRVNEIINQIEIEMISNGIVPDGTLIFTISPTFFPMRPWAMGELTAILPSLKFASLSGTIRYSIIELFV
jgi:hypothetical protein